MSVSENSFRKLGPATWTLFNISGTNLETMILGRTQDDSENLVPSRYIPFVLLFSGTFDFSTRIFQRAVVLRVVGGSYEPTFPRITWLVVGCSVDPAIVLGTWPVLHIWAVSSKPRRREIRFCWDRTWNHFILHDDFSTPDVRFL